MIYRYNHMRNKVFCSFLGMLIFWGCTKYDTPPPIAGDIPEEGDTGIKRRVLWVNMDGAVGQIVKDHIPTNLERMLPHSKYTFDALADNRTTEQTDAEDVTNWTTLLTGMDAGVHRVKDNSYIPDIVVDPAQPNQTVAYYPNVIDLIVESSPNARTLCVTPHRSLNENMLGNAFRTITSGSDEQSRDVVLESIQNQDMSLTLVSFTGMLEAGKNGGFAASNASYINALQTIDGYIGELLDAIKGRENVENEDWLVVITSGHGGNANGSWGGISRQERNTLCIFYYDRYSTVEMKGTTMHAVYFDQNNSARLVDPDQLYSAGDGRALSVEALIRFEPGPTGDYGGSGWNAMIRKRSWSIHRQRSEIILRMEAGENGSQAVQTDFSTIRNSLWHSYQFGVEPISGTVKRLVMLYDGSIVQQGTTLTPGFIEDKNDLQIGGTNIPTSYYISELRIWDKALEDNTFRDLNSQLDIQPSHPEYEHLVGYWQFTPDALVNGNTFKNQIQGKPDLVFNREPRLVEFANTLPEPRRTGSLLMENIMVTPQILYWLDAAAPANMNGFTFLDGFVNEEEWREME